MLDGRDTFRQYAAFREIAVFNCCSYGLFNSTTIRERKMRLVKAGVGALAVAATLGATQAVAQTKNLTMVTALQRTNVLARSAIEVFIPEMNKRGKGLIKVNYVGGQEVVPPRKAAAALKRNQFNILSAPTAYYIGTVPEGFALLAANQGPKVLRKNGAWEKLQGIYSKKAGGHLLAWGENMTSYYMYLTKMPPMDANGLPNLKGFKMRATGTYRPLFRALGATTIGIKSSEIFTAVQRGTIDGFGWTDVSAVALGFHKLVKYRVQPNFYQTNQVITVNEGVWKSLNKKQRDVMTDVGIWYETASVKFVEKERQREEAVIAKSMMKDINLSKEASAKYLSLAHGEIWKQLKKKSKNADMLRKLMYVDGKANRQVDTGRKLDEKR